MLTTNIEVTDLRKLSANNISSISFNIFCTNKLTQTNHKTQSQLQLTQITNGSHLEFWLELVPCFGLLVTSAPGFKAIVDSLLCVLTFLHATDSSFTYGVTPATLLTVSLVAEPFQFIYFAQVQTLMGLGSSMQVPHSM